MRWKNTKCSQDWHILVKMSKLYYLKEDLERAINIYNGYSKNTHLGLNTIEKGDIYSKKEGMKVYQKEREKLTIQVKRLENECKVYYGDEYEQSIISFSRDDAYCISIGEKKRLEDERSNSCLIKFLILVVLPLSYIVLSITYKLFIK